MKVSYMDLVQEWLVIGNSALAEAERFDMQIYRRTSGLV